ncbi:HYR domain-containing protein [Aquiflexum sp. LQ15W]|uniref:HYR domain-containing protein n=1 Tax=Cognataquiflexum nitidum TaxID=2922272 RepID=UPI001F13EDA3|nr:HYR domain-containing protein [Cognataquiflexum nitidum]MCH6202048.1 HYR domain-containing protein [Cognataquiflexum nitidum]
MKTNRLIWFFLLGQFLFPFWIQAQQSIIVGAEYFINSDPGFGNGTPFNIAQGSNPQAELEINVGDLPKGFHRLSVRFRNQDNIWGLNRSRLFYVENEGFTDPALVDYVEYFFDDDDPGLGDAIEIPLDEAASAIDLDALIAVADLEIGDHTISVRIKNNRGLWSIVETREFTVGEPLPNDPPIPDAETLPDLSAECVFNFGSLTSPTATAEDGSTVIGTTDESIFPINQQGTTTIVWTYTDTNGLESTQEQNIVIADITSPTIILPAEIIVDTNAGECFATGLNLGSPVTTDNCGIGSVVNNAPDIFSVGLTEVLWTVTDVGGNTAQFVQVVTVIDNQIPLIPEIADLQVSTDPGTCSASQVNLSTPSATDNCGIASLTNDAPEVFELGTTEVTWTAIDPSGNKTTRTFNVIVVDSEVPTIIAPADVIAVIGESEDFATDVNLGIPEVADNCALEGFSNDAEESFPVGTNTVTWTVRDESGNTAKATQTVTVTREILPTITAPPSITVNNDPGTCGASGIELGTPSVTGEDIPADGITNSALDTYPVGTSNIVWTVIDGRGNRATAVQTVTVVDNEPPSITAPAGINTLTVPSGCDSGEIDLGDPVFSDNCEIAEISNNAPEVFSLGTSIVLWTVIDVNGNKATAEQTVIVVDEELPLITAPANITIRIEADEDSAEDVEVGQPTVSDNCSIGEVSNNAPSSFPVGTTTVTWAIRDGSGNEATAEQTVTVTREILPTITAPPSITVINEPGTCVASGIDLGTPTVTGVDIPADGISNDALAAFPVGTTLVTWTVTDGNGNTATARQTVTVEDNEKPVISAVSEINRSSDLGTCKAEISVLAPTVSDNCGTPTAKGTRSDGLGLDAPYPVGSTQITWKATDASGNVADQVVQTITVNDSEAPAVTAPANINIQLLAGQESATDVDLGVPITSDNCGVAEVSNNAPASFPTGTTTVTWTATDDRGNTATDNQTVTVLPADTETELPTVTAPADILVDTGKGSCEAMNVDLGFATFTGDIPDGGLSNNAPASFPLGETIVTWMITDRKGNLATAEQRVTVRDRELPEIKAPANLVLSATSGGISSSEVDLGEPETSDNCSIAELRNNAPSVFPIGITTVTWTIIDGSGNKCTAKQRVTVNLTEEKCEVTAKAKPVVTLKLNSQGKARLTTEMVDDGSTVACGPLKLELSKCDFTCEDIGENSVKLIAKDAKGNRGVLEFKVIVVDESKPKIKVDKRTFVWMMRKGDTFTMPDFKDRVEASDNCGFELHQGPEPGTKFRKPENSFVEFEAKDPSGNKATDKFKFRLLVFRCKVPMKKGRTAGEQELSDMLIVPWNTPFDKAISEGIVFEEGSDPEYISLINWQMNDYDPLRPGLYRITASLENEGFEGRKVSLDIPVIVLDKPLAEDIMISRNKISTKVRNSEIIGSLKTLDPVDDIHSYSMEEHPNFYIEKNVLVWRGNGTPDAEMSVTVHSTDRAGQTISREITLYRELPPGEILIYPNPGRQESNILVQLSGPGKVEIRIFDATGRLVYEEKEQHEGSFVRSLDLRGLSSGMYQVVVNSGSEVMTGRLVKE